MRILVAGGAGYIGSHTCVELLKAGHKVAVADNLVNASAEALKRVEQITGERIPFYRADIRDRREMADILRRERIDGVINFAGLKAVGESVRKPLEYYDNNIGGMVALCEAMRGKEPDLQFIGHGVRRSGGDADHRSMPPWKDHQPVWAHQGHAGGHPDGSAYGGWGMEYRAAEVFQPHRRP